MWLCSFLGEVFQAFGSVVAFSLEGFRSSKEAEILDLFGIGGLDLISMSGAYWA